MCLKEFDIALHHWITDKRKPKRLIVLMASDRPNDLYANDASDTAALRHYLSEYAYIDYTADDWLDKLIYALPLHGMNQHQRPHAEMNCRRETEDNDELLAAQDNKEPQEISK